MKGLDGDKEHFTTLRCRTYTFLIIQDARRFFATELMMEDFEEDAIDNVVFPTSLLDLTAQSLALRQDPTVTNFPPKWNIGRVIGGGNGNGGDHGGNNGRFNQGWGGNPGPEQVRFPTGVMVMAHLENASVTVGQHLPW